MSEVEQKLLVSLVEDEFRLVVREWLERTGHSQEWLARQIERPLGVVGNWLRGKHAPRATDIAAIIRVIVEAQKKEGTDWPKASKLSFSQLAHFFRQPYGITQPRARGRVTVVPLVAQRAS